MKIELKHLAPYLPYGLMIDISNYKCDYVGIKRAEANGYYFIGDELHITYNGGHTGKDIGIFKPILRPMSDLVKEINGIVPFEKIASIEAPCISGAIDKIRKITAFTRGLSFNSHQLGVYYKYESVQVEITLFKGAIFHKKVTDGNDSWVFSYFHNYPGILEFLYSMHFDVFGLIPTGLAIDINTLKNETASK